MESSRKQQIKKAAALLFRKRGFSATSMRDIASALQIEAPSLYNHISGKQNLLQELLMELADGFISGMQVIESSGLTYKEQLKKIIKLHIDLTVASPNAMALLTSDWIHLEEPANSRFIELREQYEVWFKEVLSKALKEEGKGEVDLEIAFFTILSTLRWLYIWYLKHPNINAIRLENEIISNLLEGIFRK